MNLALVASSLFSGANCHAFLFNPPSRNYKRHMSGVEHCPHCLQSGGPGNVKAKAKGRWPDRFAYGSHGLCGDPGQSRPEYSGPQQEPHMVPTDVGRAVYKAGQVVEFEVHVNAHHMGHYEFRICDQGLDGREPSFTVASGQQCLDQWVLIRAPLHESCTPSSNDPDCQPIDLNHPERWYVPPVADADPDRLPVSDTPVWKDSMASPAGHHGLSLSAVHKMRYLLPEDLQCNRCTLQWYWSTGNSCLYDADYWVYFQSWPGREAWCPKCYSRWETCENTCCGVGSGWAEEFWNCADIQVIAANSSSAIPSPSPTPQVSVRTPLPIEAPTIPPTQAPHTTPLPTQRPTMIPTKAPTARPTPKPSPGPGRLKCGTREGCCLFNNGLCYTVEKSYCDRWLTNVWCPSRKPSIPPLSSPPCGSRTECCLFNDNNDVCYKVEKSYCDRWQTNIWCPSSLEQQSESQQGVLIRAHRGS